MVNTYTEAIKEDILLLLTDTPLTIAELVTRLQKPYATVQQAHKQLREEGRIIAFDRRARGGRYTLGVNNGPRSIIPKIRWDGHDIKLTQFQGRNNLVEGMAEGADIVMRAWTTIAKTAERLNEGVPDKILVKRLNTQKAELAHARAGFERMVFFINQLLDNPRLWDITYLENFPNDVDWAEFKPKLDALYEFYYTPKDN